ncbi:hypothetical protein DEFDS_1354 [Deferribacter desulfuricans SSM1]|uniref:Phospholipase C/D domain-containing protein n=1 Tax=Deferribacter desulfuricans (strain DSM 14783 / JCM 11476 / NBRC 101012 / SSM1) TaxID=639282 RepID=D3PDZ2_DEFDS|nr:zinc dependent phospholipase C family protein [Deferribacter desulfuricans]BAI80815.1 hypothetical protein DEFDS_1354 [Deferribacter desulfuricans SSM1]
MIVLVFALIFSIIPSVVFAWGFETHVTIGLKILDNVSFSLIKDYPVHFLLGNIFPDFFNLFKDISPLKKQLKTHSWETVSKLFKSAKYPYEKSFAYGYAAHLSADIVAHNYFVPHSMLLVSKNKLFSHFLVEYAEESYNDKKIYYTLRYLLDHALENGKLFIETFKIDEKYFTRQIRMLKSGITYQKVFKFAKIANKIKKTKVKDFKERCDYFGEQSYLMAKHSVERGFFDFVKYDPSGKKRMDVAKINRDILMKDIGKKRMKLHDKENMFIDTHKPDFNKY